MQMFLRQNLLEKALKQLPECLIWLFFIAIFIIVIVVFFRGCSNNPPIPPHTTPSTPNLTNTPSATPTHTSTATNTPTATDTASASPTFTATPTFTPSPTVTNTPTATPLNPVAIGREPSGVYIYRVPDIFTIHVGLIPGDTYISVIARYQPNPGDLIEWYLVEVEGQRVWLQANQITISGNATNIPNVTLTHTPAPTLTLTPTFTVTPTFTPTHTPTASTTPSATPTATATDTPSAAPSPTATITPIPSSTSLPLETVTFEDVQALTSEDDYAGYALSLRSGTFHAILQPKSELSTDPGRPHSLTLYRGGVTLSSGDYAGALELVLAQDRNLVFTLQSPGCMVLQTVEGQLLASCLAESCTLANTQLIHGQQLQLSLEGGVEAEAYNIISMSAEAMQTIYNMRLAENLPLCGQD